MIISFTPSFIHAGALRTVAGIIYALAHSYEIATGQASVGHARWWLVSVSVILGRACEYSVWHTMRRLLSRSGPDLHLVLYD